MWSRCRRREGGTLEKSPNPVSVAELLSEIVNCRVCADMLAAGPRPVVQFSGTSRIVIIGQAPGARVHASGDATGERLREWTGLSDVDFYDPAKVALVPMAFCYPGTGESGDLPPRPECAPLWHERVMAHLPGDRLTLLVGGYAQKRYLPGLKRQTLTEIVRDAGSRIAGFSRFRIHHGKVPFGCVVIPGLSRKRYPPCVQRCVTTIDDTTLMHETNGS